MKYHVFIMSIPILFLSACVTNPDPHEGGFVGGVQGLSSGEYDRRSSERQARLDRMKVEQTNLDNQSSALQYDKAFVQKKISTEKHYIAQLKKDSRKLKKKIARLKNNDVTGQKKINSLEHQVEQLTKDINTISYSLNALEGGGGGNTSEDQQRRQLEAQRRELQNEYQLLLDMTLELGQ